MSTRDWHESRGRTICLDWCLGERTPHLEMTIPWRMQNVREANYCPLERLYSSQSSSTWPLDLSAYYMFSTRISVCHVYLIRTLKLVKSKKKKEFYFVTVNLLVEICVIFSYNSSSAIGCTQFPFSVSPIIVLPRLFKRQLKI